MTYRYRTTDAFWKSFYALSPEQKASTRAAWAIFKQDPFDPRLRTHKIHHVSAVTGMTVHAVRIEGDLRALFTQQGDIILTLDIGTHDIYKR
jgi:hypothetical protein